jgi:hypothetical protein
MSPGLKGGFEKIRVDEDVVGFEGGFEKIRPTAMKMSSGFKGFARTKMSPGFKFACTKMLPGLKGVRHAPPPNER